MVRKVKPEGVTELREAHLLAELDAEHAQHVAHLLADAVYGAEQGQSPQVREN